MNPEIHNRPFALSIAGYDPSGGAGVLADIKTFESLGICGMAAVTAITAQNDNEFRSIGWLETQQVIEQVDVLFSRYHFDVVKIGLIKDLQSLKTIIDLLTSLNPGIKIIWDPILKASAGFEFHSYLAPELLRYIIPKLFLITPNIPEAIALSGNTDTAEAGRLLSRNCALLLKGGHSDGNASTDILFQQGDSREPVLFHSERVIRGEKHGSGCVLSSAIAAFLAKGLILEAAVLKAKHYTRDFLRSSETKLGYHRPGPTKAISRLHFITDTIEGLSHAEQAARACKGGIDWVQLRIKDRSYSDCLSIAREVKEVCDAYGARLIINDHVGIAKEIKAHGVHLGREDMSAGEARKLLGNDLIIGGTANTATDIERLYNAHVDYIGLGPYRDTSTKKNLSPLLGDEGIRDTILRCADMDIPVIAIGGIKLEDLPALESTGAYGVAVSSAIGKALSIEKQAFSFTQCVNELFGNEKYYKPVQTVS